MNKRLTDLETLRAQDLLAQRATEGLDAAGQAELERLGAADLDAFDVAAAEVALAEVAVEPIPAALAEKVLAAALRSQGDEPKGATAGAVALASPSTAPAVPAVAAVLPGQTAGSLPRITRSSRTTPPPSSRASDARGGWGRWSFAVAGWAAAAALAVVVGMRTPASRDADVGGQAAGTVERAPMPRGAIIVPLVAGGDTSGQAVAGEVIWDAAARRGELHVRGLAINEARVERYQLWIVDAAREPGQAVDGGLFDVTASGPVVVPIEPRLPLVRPTEILVTVEAPIGAVVSTRGRTAARATLPVR